MSRKHNKADMMRRLHAVGKHEKYQLLHPAVAAKVGVEKDVIYGHVEAERFAFLQSRAAVRSSSVVDIGANTGYFTIAAAAEGARSVVSYEPHRAHAELIEFSAGLLGYEKTVRVRNQNFDFFGNSDCADICFCLNVLHHYGDDFGISSVNLDEAKKFMREAINRLASLFDVMLLQIGYNWKGNTKCPLFDRGAKLEQIAFVSEAVRMSWEIAAVGIFDGKERRFVEPTSRNLRRQDALGEFLNRPIFLMRSLGKR